MPSEHMVQVAFNKALALEKEGKLEEAEKWLKLALRAEQRIKEIGESKPRVVK